MTMLLLSARSTEDNQALWRAAIRSGWNVERIRGLTVPDGLSNEEVVLYVEALFAPGIAKKLSLKLIEPDEDWLVKLPYEYRRRVSPPIKYYRRLDKTWRPTSAAPTMPASPKPQTAAVRSVCFMRSGPSSRTEG